MLFHPLSFSVYFTISIFKPTYFSSNVMGTVILSASSFQKFEKKKPQRVNNAIFLAICFTHLYFSVLCATVKTKIWCVLLALPVQIERLSEEAPLGFVRFSCQSPLIQSRNNSFFFPLLSRTSSNWYSLWLSRVFWDLSGHVTCSQAVWRIRCWWAGSTTVSRHAPPHHYL